jgi:hypothetical protein
MGGIAGSRHQKPVFYKKFLQQNANTLVVVYDQQMCIQFAHVLLSFRRV